MKAQLIKLLERRWVTPLIALQQVGCLSLSQRCGELRRDGVRVADKWISSNGKRYKAYRIVASKKA